MYTLTGDRKPICSGPSEARTSGTTRLELRSPNVSGCAVFGAPGSCSFRLSPGGGAHGRAFLTSVGAAGLGPHFEYRGFQ